MTIKILKLLRAFSFIFILLLGFLLVKIIPKGIPQKVSPTYTLSLILPVIGNERLKQNCPSLWQNGFKIEKTVKFIEHPYIFEISYKGLPPGNYTLKFEPNGKCLFEEDIVISNEDELLVYPSINLDDSYAGKSKKLITKQFFNQKDSDSPLRLNLDSRGCFHFTKQEISIYQNNGEYFFDYNNLEKNIQKKHIALQQNDIANIIDIEKEGLLLRGYGCTTVKTFRLSWNKRRTVFIDGTCGESKWNAFIANFNLRE